MKKLRNKSMKSMIVIILTILICGIVMLCAAVLPLSTVIRGPQDLTAIDVASDLDGVYVTTTLYQNYGCYCEETENGKVKARYYGIDAGPDSLYMVGMKASGSKMDKADALADATDQYYNYEITESELDSYCYEVTGTLKKMNSEDLRYYHQAIGYSSLSEEEQEIYLPYYLEVGAIGDHNLFSLIAFLVLSAVMIIAAIVLFIRCLGGAYQKSVKRYIESSSNAMVAEEKVNNFLNNTEPVYGLQFNRDFICGQNGANTMFGETGKLVWAYMQTTTHKRYFITVGKTYQLALVFTDGSRQFVSVKKKEFCEELLARLKPLCPRAIIGYDERIDKLYQKNFRSLLELKYYAQETAASEPTE
ncbi:MAG: hypothetical protein IJ468_12285 [Lachnospiraceae bacterium]|nr:hypothetical protein [Lachnospiraceae bacterium]